MEYSIQVKFYSSIFIHKCLQTTHIIMEVGLLGWWWLGFFSSYDTYLQMQSKLVFPPHVSLQRKDTENIHRKY